MVEPPAYQEKARILRVCRDHPDIAGLVSRVREHVRLGRVHAPPDFPCELLVDCVLVRGIIEEGLELPEDYTCVIKHLARSFYRTSPELRDWGNWFQAQDVVGRRLVDLWNAFYDLEFPVL